MEIEKTIGKLEQDGIAEEEARGIHGHGKLLLETKGWNKGGWV